MNHKAVRFVNDLLCKNEINLPFDVWKKTKSKQGKRRMSNVKNGGFFAKKGWQPELPPTSEEPTYDEDFGGFEVDEYKKEVRTFEKVVQVQEVRDLNEALTMCVLHNGNNYKRVCAPITRELYERLRTKNFPEVLLFFIF